MRIFLLDVALQGFNEVTVNGRRLETGDAEIDEKIIAKKLSLEQQWQLICVMKKNINKLYAVYRDARVASGEITTEDLRRSERKRAHAKGPKPRLL
jgi:hypothetical protein